VPGCRDLLWLAMWLRNGGSMRLLCDEIRLTWSEQCWNVSPMQRDGLMMMMMQRESAAGATPDSRVQQEPDGSESLGYSRRIFYNYFQQLHLLHPLHACFVTAKSIPRSTSTARGVCFSRHPYYFSRSLAIGPSASRLTPPGPVTLCDNTLRNRGWLAG
jgi:hypothetical protein